jgi:hypothetical protein
MKMTLLAKHPEEYPAQTSARTAERDGLEENIIRMRALSDHLNRYFAMRTMGETYGDE